ncbi:MAG: matrixin family metalloprotease [Oenococcus sp.]|uniref:Peptidase M10 metallopeptidase domain-containing protein n=1 Tax=Oenococcus kitaharae DSM 17330 TaxID=1045004 RepID=G9WF20_9LACO|nr:matrixin family metalloprotease [Oenococcus kitaharae]EHN58580.1 hypothetical protein OKIT_0462 [Oenococcus kitaharae DSM 17330]MCV3296193.1 matrixin family metalloprotease [Oenococcus kitaharae]OEY84710.1 peptidase [Oenococcus kitaharae]OEY84994.1 peptidase [Oenococcus kitaharae]OEY85784.1 peptidase [Oenococcus kitaharae]
MRQRLAKNLQLVLSLIAILLLLAASFTFVLYIRRPALRDSVMTTQIPRNKKVLINLSQTHYAPEARKAMSLWNKALKRHLFHEFDQSQATITLYDLSNQQFSKINRDVGYGEHILAATGQGGIYLNRDFMQQVDDQPYIIPVIEHELGHVIGLKHINGDALMNASMQSTAFISQYDVQVANYILKRIH